MISTTVTKHIYTSNGLNRDWDYAFPIVENSDIQLWVTAPGGVATLVSTGLYIVTENVSGADGGLVEYPITPRPPLASGYTVTIMRVLPLIQETEFVNQGRIQAESIEDGLDRLTMITQQLSEILGRAITVNVDNTTITDVDSLLLVLTNYIQQVSDFVDIVTALLEEAREIRDEVKENMPSGWNRFRVNPQTMELIMSYFGETTSDEIWIEDGHLMLRLYDDDQSVGRVAMVWRGAWSVTTNYPYLSLVSYLGSTYLCIAEAGTTGSIPTNTVYWSQVAQRGNDGISPTITVNSTTTLAPGTPATVANIGTTQNAIFTFGIPQGEKGDDGAGILLGEAFDTLADLQAAYPTGAATSHVARDTSILYVWNGSAWVDGGIVQGAKGDAATIAVGATQTGAAGTAAAVANSGTTSAAIFDFTIPKGDKGDTGEVADVDAIWNAIDSIDSIPIGTVAQFAMDTPPDDTWIIGDGSTQQTTDYPVLAGLLGYTGTTFVVPDYRDYFLRGHNPTGTRTIGSEQTDAIRNITGNIGIYAYNSVVGLAPVLATGAFSKSIYTDFSTVVSASTSTATGNVPNNMATLDSSLVVPTAEENRPINKTVLICIKAKSSSGNLRGSSARVSLPVTNATDFGSWYRKMDNRTVLVNIDLKPTATTTGLLVATLPEGFYPKDAPYAINISALNDAGTANGTTLTFQGLVKTDGTIVMLRNGNYRMQGQVTLYLN